MGTVTNSAFASATFCDLGKIFHSNLSGINHSFPEFYIWREHRWARIRLSLNILWIMSSHMVWIEGQWAPGRYCCWDEELPCFVTTANFTPLFVLCELRTLFLTFHWHSRCPSEKTDETSGNELGAAHSQFTTVAKMKHHWSSMDHVKMFLDHVRIERTVIWVELCPQGRYVGILIPNISPYLGMWSLQRKWSH